MPSLKKQVDAIFKDLKSQTQLKTQLDKELYVMEKYKDLYTEYPFLLKKITKIQMNNDTTNLEVLYIFLAKLDAINKGHENKEEVEHELGQELANRFLNKDNN